jgi:RNA recognition motif-containing protein
VNTVTIVTDKNSGESKGYGFITMTDDAGARRAIQAMDGVTIGGRTVSVRFAEEKQNVSLPEQQQRKGASSHRGNVPDAPKPKRPRRRL